MGNLRRKTTTNAPISIEKTMSALANPAPLLSTANNSTSPSSQTKPKSFYWSLDLLLYPFSTLLFKSNYLSFFIWSLLPFLLFPLVHLACFVVCWSVGFMTLVLYYSRRNKSVKLDWKNQIVLITGGSNGVGKELASYLAITYQPRKIIVLDVIPCALSHSSIVYYECDISDKRQVKSVAEQIFQDYGHPTLLVNNAGIVKGKNITHLTESDFEKTMGVNFFGQVYTIKTFLPKMLEKNQGHILNVASVMGLTGASHMTDYCASKFASIGFTESLRQDLRSTRIKVSCIYPGLIDTGMFNGVSHKYAWLTPPLNPFHVAKQMAGILNSNQSQDVKLPFYSNLVPLMRFLPIEFSDGIREKTGANSDMLKFSPTNHSPTRTNS